MNLQSVLSILGLKFLDTAFVLVVCFAPFFVLMLVVHFQRKRFRADYLEPFTEMPLRPPGESLRIKIESLAEELQDSVLKLLGVSLVASAILMLSAIKATGLVWIVTVVFLGVSYFIYGRRSLRQLKQLRDYRLGLKGECAVGQELNQLVAEGFQVFHDLPFDSFNIDHVIVGPAGVWAVETKTRRKPAAIKGAAKALVIYEGQTLQFPWGRDRFGLDQAKHNAAALSKWLSAATGEFTPVAAMLVLPGWWVERKAYGSVNVLNPKEVRRAFPQRPASPLNPERIQRIAFLLIERCRLERP